MIYYACLEIIFIAANIYFMTEISVDKTKV